MALAIGSGFQPKIPKPQPSHSYAAAVPSGPYAAPAIPNAGTGWANRWVPNAATPQAAVASARTPEPITNFMFGFGNTFNPTNIPKIPGGLAFAAQHPGQALRGMGTAEGAGGLLAALMPGVGMGGRLGAVGRDSGMAGRVASYPAGEVTNPQLLSRMGEHADLAENVIANKAFDRELSKSQSAGMLRRASDQGYTLGAMLKGATPPHIQSPFATAKTASRGRRVNDAHSLADQQAGLAPPGEVFSNPGWSNIAQMLRNM